MIKFFIKLISLALFTFVCGFFIYCAVVLLWMPPKNNNQTYDAIIVLTGAQGRIEKGFELILDGQAPVMLISGVLDQVPYGKIIENNSENLSKTDKETLLNHCCIELDYVADSTETNATETTKWINSNGIKNIVLVTSYNHMPRAYLQFHFALDSDIKITSYPYRNENRLSLILSPSFWQNLSKEYIKFGGSLVRIIRDI